jgi:hypothetical protein
LSSLREDKINIFKTPCNILLHIEQDIFMIREIAYWSLCLEHNEANDRTVAHQGLYVPHYNIYIKTYILHADIDVVLGETQGFNEEGIDTILPLNPTLCYSDSSLLRLLVLYRRGLYLTILCLFWSWTKIFTDICKFTARSTCINQR